MRLTVNELRRIIKEEVSEAHARVAGRSGDIREKVIELFRDIADHMTVLSPGPDGELALFVGGDSSGDYDALFHALNEAGWVEEMERVLGCQVLPYSANPSAKMSESRRRTNRRR